MSLVSIVNIGFVQSVFKDARNVELGFVASVWRWIIVGLCNAAFVERVWARRVGMRR